MEKPKSVKILKIDHNWTNWMLNQKQTKYTKVYSFQKQTMWVKGEDGQMVECEVVATKDHESVFTKNAPILPLPIAVICGILNFVPGKTPFPLFPPL